MAKSKSFFGLRSGSTKSLTFQVYRGQQITKDRVTRISNPRSEAQMRQRAIIPIVAASRAALKGLVNHSFEGVAYGEQSLKKFSELNLRAGAIDVESYSPNGVSNPGFASLIVSTGSLSDGGCKIGFINVEGQHYARYNFSVQANKDLVFKAAKAGDNADDVLKTIAEWGATECEVVAPGNQLTFLTASLVNYVKVGDNRAPTSAFDINRIIFPSAESTPAQLDGVNGAWIISRDVNEGANNVSLSNGTASVYIAWSKEDPFPLEIHVQPQILSQYKVCGGAIIRSAYINGVWKRSNANINVKIPIGEDKYTYEMWRSYYESTGVSAKYLNQGSEGSGVQG